MLCSCQEKKSERFEREAREFTEKNCPQHLDPITTLDSLVFEPAGVGTLKQYYTLDLDDESREAFMNKLGEIGDTNLKIVKNSVLFIKHKDAGVTFSYIYFDAATGDKLVQYDFMEEQYK